MSRASRVHEMVHTDPHTRAIDGVERLHFLHACAQLLDLPVAAQLDVIGQGWCRYSRCS